MEGVAGPGEVARGDCRDLETHPSSPCSLVIILSYYSCSLILSFFLLPSVENSVIVSYKGKCIVMKSVIKLLKVCVVFFFSWSLEMK